MKRFKPLLVTALVGAGVAITYYFFERAVHHSIDYIWSDLFNTEKYRLLVVPVGVGITLAFFYAQHLLDPKSEGRESHGLGDIPKPTVANYAKILFIGFLSLVAGASLGPEAVLVPACVLLGSYIGAMLEKNNQTAVRMFGMAGFIGLFAAFFNSFLAGMLSLLLIKKEFKLDINIRVVVFAAIASASTVITLNYLGGPALFQIPEYSWKLNIATIFALVILFAAGYITTNALGMAHRVSQRVIKAVPERGWWAKGLAAGAVLSVLYLLGGSLVQFTGNESVQPMLKQAAELGFIGLLWVLIIKLVAIGWSKAAGYRGGLVFPTVFAASVLVAIVQLYVDDLNMIYGLLAAMTGILYAETKVKILLE